MTIHITLPRIFVISNTYHVLMLCPNPLADVYGIGLWLRGQALDLGRSWGEHTTGEKGLGTAEASPTRRTRSSSHWITSPHHRHHPAMSIISPKGGAGAGGALVSGETIPTTTPTTPPGFRIFPRALRKKMGSPGVQGIRQLHTIMIMPHQGFRNVWLDDSGWSTDT